MDELDILCRSRCRCLKKALCLKELRRTITLVLGPSCGGEERSDTVEALAADMEKIRRLVKRMKKAAADGTEKPGPIVHYSARGLR